MILPALIAELTAPEPTVELEPRALLQQAYALLCEIDTTQPTKLGQAMGLIGWVSDHFHELTRDER